MLPLVGAQDAGAQAGEPDEVVIFVLDLSGSMNEPFDAGRTKLDVAKAAFVEAFANVSPDARVGLRTYGDQLAPTTPDNREPSCTTDTRVVTQAAPLQRDQLIAQVQGFTALGDTPMGLALQRASGDIPAGSTGTIVLFSDGRDECYDADLDGDPAVGPSYGQDPCSIAKAITAGDAAVDRVVTVGFRADTAAETELRCIADSTGGSYTAIETPADARDALPDLLVQLSAPREAQRLIGRAIQGSTTTEEAPDLVRLDEVVADKVLYTDSIDMDSVRIYRMAEYGPEGGTFTATVFGLPAELGIALDMRIYIPSLDQRFFQGEHGNFDAGLPASPTTSIRCTDCTISGGPYEAFFVVTLDSETPTVTGTYELEILTEGPGFGGPTTSCSAPQACFYPQEIIDQNAALETIQAELDGGVGELAPAELIAERDRLRGQFREDQDAITAAETRAAELEAIIPLAPSQSNSFRLPLLLILLGLVLAFAPLNKLKRAPKDPDLEEDTDDTSEADRTNKGAKSDEPRSGEPLPMTAPAPERTGPSLDVGPAPAINPNHKDSGPQWEAELEAAKVALAQQRPTRPATAAADNPPADAAAAAPNGPPQHGNFSAAQHAAAQAAAQQIAAQRAAEKISDSSDALASPPAPPTPAAAVQAATPEQIAALQTAAATPPAQAVEPPTQPPTADSLEDSPKDSPADGETAAHVAVAEPDQAAEQLDPAPAQQVLAEAAIVGTTEQTAQVQAAGEQTTAEQAAAEEAARLAADQATAERVAAEQRAAAEQRMAEEQAARKQAAAEEAARLAAEQATAEEAARLAAEQAQRETNEREAAEQEAREHAAAEEAARLAAEQAEREAAEQAAAERLAAEQAQREAAERAAAEQAERAAAEKAAAEQAAREEAARLAAEQAAREEAARLEAEQAAREQAAREAAEKAAAEQAAREQAAREQAAREAAEQAAREEAARLAAEQAAREQAAREAAEKAAAEQAAREQAAREEAEREAAERIVAQKAAAEQAARLAAERLAAEKAAAERASAEREAAEQAAHDAAERAAADRAAAERASAEREAAEQAAHDAAERAAADRAAAERASAERVAAEEAAREAAVQREAAEQAALEAAAERAAQEAAAQAARSAGADDATSKAPMSEEEQRQEARRRMLAKQNIVASSSSGGSAGAGTSADAAGTSASLRPMTVPPAAATGTGRVEQATPDAPGWYDDPAIVGQFRWWDGGTWTGYTAADDQGAPPE